MRRIRRLGLTLAAAALGAVAFAADPTARASAGAQPPLRVLFLGNSLTYFNDLPALVQAMAAAGGNAIECTDRTAPDYALEDHWSGGARRVLQRGKFDVVVMQQGPSTLPDSRAHLRTWTKKWCDFARSVGTEPVLYMVWPYATQRGGFLLASESYRDAARSSAARIFPAGEAWALALNANPRISLYQSDALHPTETGSYLAALVIAKGLTGLDPALVPAKLKLKNGATFAIDEAHAKLFRAIAARLRYEDSPAPATSAASSTDAGSGGKARVGADTTAPTAPPSSVTPASR